MTNQHPSYDDRYPFGVLTVPWYVLGCILAAWAFGPLYIYQFAFAADRRGWGDDKSGAQELAEYVGFGFVIVTAIIVAVALSIIHRETFRLAMPRPRDVLLPAVISTLIFMFPYAAVIVFYEKYRFSLPSDGNWAAIGGICSVGFAHFIALTAMAKSFRRPD